MADANLEPLQLSCLPAATLQVEHLAADRPNLLVQVQKIESNHEQLAKIGERTDEIKDLHTRHELTVKRNREVQPEVIIGSHRACSHLRQSLETM